MPFGIVFQDIPYGAGISRIMRMRMILYEDELFGGRFSLTKIKEKDGVAASSLIARSTNSDSLRKFDLTSLRTCLVSLSKDRFLGSCPSSFCGLPPSAIFFLLKK